MYSLGLKHHQGLIDLDGGCREIYPGLIEFSSGLLHVYISRMVIIVWYRLDQFAFNPDFGDQRGLWRVRPTKRRDRKRGQEAILSASLLLHLCSVMK